MDVKKDIEMEFVYCPVVWIGDQYYEKREEIIRMDSFKATIHSDEITSHNRPHVHVEYKNIKYECTIDNIIEVIKPDNIRPGIKRYITDIIARCNNLIIARKTWNKIKSNYKFKESDLTFSKCKIERVDDMIIIETSN